MAEQAPLCPDLQAIRPGVKEAVTGPDALCFDVCEEQGEEEEVGRQRPQLEEEEDGRVSFVREVLSREECQSLQQAMDSCSHLSFWNDQGRGHDAARLFRDADTVEVTLPSLAEKIWRRVAPVLDLSPIVIGEEDDEHTNPHWERDLPGEWHPCGLNHNFLFARYPEGGHFAPHTDGRVVYDFNVRSFRSVIIYLNDIPLENGGGGTRFYDKSALEHLKQNERGQWTCDKECLGDLVTIEVSAETGKFLSFDQTLVHEGISCKNDYCKYIIRSDIMYQRVPPLLTSDKDQMAYNIFRQAEEMAENGDVDGSIVQFRRAFKLSPELAHLMGS